MLNDKNGREHTYIYTNTHTQIHTSAHQLLTQANYTCSQTSNPCSSSRAPLCFYAVNDIIVWRRCRVFTAPPNATAPAFSNAADGRWRKNESGNNLLLAEQSGAGMSVFFFFVLFLSRRGEVGGVSTTGSYKCFFPHKWILFEIHEMLTCLNHTHIFILFAELNLC